jgi:hypothetical protein
MNIRPLLGSLAAALCVSFIAPGGHQAFAAPNAEHASAHTTPLAMLAADVTNLTVYGPTAHGVRVDVAFKGTLQGRIAGTMEGVDYSTIRADGVTEVNVHAKIMTFDQAIISVEIEGTLVNGQVTDTHVRLLTAAPQYAYLQDKIIVGTGFATQEKLGIKYFIVD